MSSREFPSQMDMARPYGPSSWRVRMEVWLAVVEAGSASCSSLLCSLVDLGRVEDPVKMICGLRDSGSAVAELGEGEEERQERKVRPSVSS